MGLGTKGPGSGSFCAYIHWANTPPCVAACAARTLQEARSQAERLIAENHLVHTKVKELAEQLIKQYKGSTDGAGSTGTDGGHGGLHAGGHGGGHSRGHGSSHIASHSSSDGAGTGAGQSGSLHGSSHGRHRSQGGSSGSGVEEEGGATVGRQVRSAGSSGLDWDGEGDWGGLDEDQGHGTAWEIRPPPPPRKADASKEQ